jgi:integrase
MKLELSERLIAGLGAGDYFDSRMPGLNLRVSPLPGPRTWFYVFTAPKDGKRARFTLGRYPSTKLARARALAIETRALVERGIDPRRALPADAAMTVAMLTEGYLRKHVTTLRGARELERRLRVDVLPVIGSVKLADLHRRDVHRFLDPIVERGAPVSARRVFDDFRAMVRWAVARGDMDSNPLSGAKPPAASPPRERVLDDLEIGLLWRAWPTVFSEPMALALKLALTTGQRIGEVCGLTLSEIDFTKRAWTIPASRAKNKHSHSVPLSDLALKLIEEARTDGDDQLFKISAGRVARILVERRKLLPVKDWTAHDLRRTALTAMARLGVEPLVLGHIANHRTTTRAGMTLAVYVRYDYGREKAAALELWADRLAAIVGTGAAKITPIRARDRP